MKNFIFGATVMYAVILTTVSWRMANKLVDAEKEAKKNEESKSTESEIEA